MRKIFLLIACCSVLSGTAQTSKKKLLVGMYANIAGGMAAGESGVFPVSRLAAGLHRQMWYAGMGISYDAYKFNSLAYFLNGKIDIGQQRKFFLFADLGWNRVDDKNVKDEVWGTDHYRGGPYFDSGLGINFKLGKKNRLFFSSGYSFKQVNSIKYVVNPCITAPCPENKYDYRYNLGRLITRFGWEFSSSK